jgi:hypothetical protein
MSEIDESKYNKLLQRNKKLEIIAKKCLSMFDEHERLKKASRRTSRIRTTIYIFET